jgi:hypothetical protein
MLMPSSGRFGFDVMQFEAKGIKLPDVETVKAMLRRENELRLSSEFQRLLESNQEATAERLYDGLQRQVAAEFGFRSESEQALGRDIMRCALSLYKNDPEIAQIPIYVKYNRSEQGLLKVGDDCPDIDLANLQGSETKLSEFTGHQLPLVLVAGSYT